MNHFKTVFTAIFINILGNVFSQNIIQDIVSAKQYFEKGNISFILKKSDSAFFYYSKAEHLFKKYSQDDMVIRCLSKKADILISEQKYVDAEKMLNDNSKNSIEIFGKDNTEEAYCYSMLAKVYNSGFNKNDKAIEYLETALKIYKKHNNEDKLDIADLYCIYGDVLTSKSEFYKAIDFKNKALEIKKEILGNEHYSIARIYVNKGILYYYIGEFDKCTFYFEKALPIIINNFGEYNFLTSAVINNLAVIYENTGKFEDAEKYYLKSLKTTQNLFGEQNQYVADSYNNLGGFYQFMGDIEKALTFLEKSLKIKLNIFGEKGYEVAVAYNNLGNAYLSNKEIDLAIEFYLKAINLYRGVIEENDKEYATVYYNLGNAYADKGLKEKAFVYYNKALKIRIKIFGKKHHEVAIVYNNIGTLYNNENEVEEALLYLNKSLEIRKLTLDELDPNIAYSYNNISEIYNRMNNFQKAVEYGNKALNIRKTIYGKKNRHVAHSYYVLGLFYTDNNNFQIALKNYQNAICADIEDFSDSTNYFKIPLIKNYFDWNILLNLLNNKAEVFKEISKTCEKDSVLFYKNSALSHYMACDTLISKVRQEINTKVDKILLGKKANTIYGAAANLCIDILDFYDKPPKKNDDSYKIYTKVKESAFYFSEKNKSSVLLSALSGAEAQKFAGIPDSLLQKEHKLKINIAFYKKQLAEMPDSAEEIEYRNQLFSLNRKYDKLIRFFEMNYSKYYELKYNQELISVSDIQKQLNRKTALMSYFLTDSFINIYYISNKNYYAEQVPQKNNFTEQIQNFRNNISDVYLLQNAYAENDNTIVNKYEKDAYDLYSILFPDKIKKLLKGGFFSKIRNLIIIPDGQLSMIPFEALLTKNYSVPWTNWNNTSYFSEMPYLLKDYNISYSYSANLFYETHPKTDDKPEFQNISDWLALAPVFDNDSISGTNLRTRKLIEKNSTDQSGNIDTRAWLRNGSYISPLPGSEEETIEIFKIFEENNKKAILKTHQYANEDYVKSGALKNFKYLHFATHGMVNEEKPELSCILLAQDTTSTEDNILFSGEIYNLELNADLTVLSACETGLGKIAEGEGVIGLTRALLYAGSKNVIVSLWQVSDESTNQLMVEFYKNIFKDKKEGFTQHLSKAKRKLINEGKFAHPFFWSPFVLIGE